jgi:hypothetical protein
VGVVYGGEETEHNGMKDRAMIMVIHHWSVLCCKVEDVDGRLPGEKNSVLNK